MLAFPALNKGRRELKEGWMDEEDARRGRLGLIVKDEEGVVIGHCGDVALPFSKFGFCSHCHLVLYAL
jgi:hypothetical protein